MKRNRLLVGVLSTCLAVMQMPVYAFAAAPDASQEVLIGGSQPKVIERTVSEEEADLTADPDVSAESIVIEEERDKADEVIVGAYDSDVFSTESGVGEIDSVGSQWTSEEKLGDGSTVNISSAADLIAIKDNLLGNYVLTQDINLSSYSEWTPIGTGTGDNEAFKGVIDGKGHKITLGEVSGSSTTYFGLFGCVKNATIKNLDVEITISSGQTVGGLAGYTNETIIESCSVRGSVTGSADVGGIVGYAHNTFMRNCYSTADVIGSSSNANDGVGGLIGEMHGEDGNKYTQIICSYAVGNVSKNGTNGIGGLTGRRSTSYSGNTAILSSFYGETGTSDECSGFSVRNSELKDEITFTGWDFNNIWTMDASNNDGYPYLKRTGSYQTFSLSGAGTAVDPYIITNEAELAALARNEIGTNALGYCYKLANDIVLTGTYWTPIGGNGLPNFTGSFDGDGHSITNLKIGSVGYGDQGLFGAAGNTSSVIKNLDIVNANITDASTAGILAGRLNYATIEACSTSGKVTGKVDVGGLAGYVHNSTVRNSYSIAEVTGTSTATSDGVGGLIGEMHGEDGNGYSRVIMSYAAGTVTKSISNGVGGLTGYRTTSYSGHTVILDSYFSARTKQSDKNSGFSLKHDKLKNPGTFVYWDFENVWECKEDELPTLKRTKEYVPVKLSGQGTVKSPYIITNERELAAVARGEIPNNNYTAYYNLANDIEITSEYWTPIGGNGTDDFTGSFDGKGHKISGLTIIYQGYVHEGLFGAITGTITHLELDKVKISDGGAVGAIAGYMGNGSSISYCSAAGVISGSDDLGGLVSYGHNPVISNSYAAVSLTSSSDAASVGVGGIIGELHGEDSDKCAKIVDCYAVGKLTKEKTSNGVGGLAGVRNTSYSGHNVILDSFYDKDTTGVAETTSGFGVATAVMKNRDTFTYWDFQSVWGMDSSINSGYPYLTHEGEYTGVVPEGSGVELDPYEIRNEKELAALAKGELEFDGYYELKKDIVLTCNYWTPIGSNGMNSFSGVFDGNGHTIAGIRDLALGYTEEGLFGSVSGTVKNLRVTGEIMNAYCGGLISSRLERNSKVTNCAVTGSISGTGNIGGLAGYSFNTTVQNTYSRVDVTNTSSQNNAYTGGLIGWIHSEDANQKNLIENCYASGEVIKNAAGVGGMIGYANVSYSGSNVVNNCFYDNRQDSATDRGTYTSTENMKLQSTYTGWDFDDIWSISSTENDGYPQLQIFAGKPIPVPTVVAVTGVTLNKSQLTLEAGKSETLKATVAPADATNTKIKWTSSNEAVATVTQAGKITAVTEGTATITVTTDDGGKEATCALTVTRAQGTTAVKLNKNKLTLQKEKDETLTVAFTPEDTKDKEITWSSSDETIATVDQTGKVTAVKAGKATITVTLVSDATITDSCEVTVTDEKIKPTAVALSETTLSLNQGKEATLTVIYTPADANDTEVVWTSNNESVATVDQTGKVTAVKAGTATITVTLVSDATITDSCEVTVTDEKIKPTAIALSEATLSLDIGKEAKLTVTYTPANANDTEIVWTSNNESVATVDQTGRIKAITAGTATIIATLKSDASIKAECTITVKENSVEPEPVPTPTPVEESYDVVFYVDNTELAKVTIVAGDTIYDVMPDTADILQLLPPDAVFAGWYIDGTSTLWDITTPVNRKLALEARYVMTDGSAGSKDQGSGRDPGLIAEAGTSTEVSATYFYDVYMVQGQSYTFPVKYGDIDRDSTKAQEPITWTSSDSNVIKVSSKYKAKAQQVTDPSREVYVFDGKDYLVSDYVYDIHIVSPKLTVNGTDVPKSLSLVKNENAQLAVSGLGTYDDMYDITWYTSNAEIARVDDGLVTATGKGTAKISAFVNGKAYTCSVKVTDFANPGNIGGATTIKLTALQSAALKFKVQGFKNKGLIWSENGENLKAYNNQGLEISAEDKKVKYYQNSVVRVTPTGKVTAIGTGNVTLTALDPNSGKTVDINFDVPQPTNNVIYINKGKKKSIKLYNVKAKSNHASWKYGDTSSVNFIDLNRKNGSVTGAAAGKATVICEYDQYNTGKPIVYTTTIFVEDPKVDTSDTSRWTSGKISTLKLNTGEKYVIKVNNVYQPVVFTSNKPGIVFVDEAGVVSARGKGNVTLTARVNAQKITVKVDVAN